MARAGQSATNADPGTEYGERRAVDALGGSRTAAAGDRTQHFVSPPAAGRRARCLVVDDDEMIREFTGSMVAALGVLEVVTAEDGEDALRKLHAQDDRFGPFVLVLTDVIMP